MKDGPCPESRVAGVASPSAGPGTRGLDEVCADGGRLSGVSAPQESGGDVDPRRGMAGGRRESFPSVGGREREARARVPTSVHFVLEQVLRR